jgi:hypothetical protein
MFQTSGGQLFVVVGQVTLYLGSVFVDDMSLGNPDVIDRCDRGLQRPWGSEVHHVPILNKPEQLRGPLSPHCKTGIQTREAGAYLQAVSTRMPHGMRMCLCVLDSQDSCCPSIRSREQGREFSVPRIARFAMRTGRGFEIGAIARVWSS